MTDLDLTQYFVGQLVFKKDFSDTVTTGFKNISYDVTRIISDYKLEAKKVISELKEKGILNY